MWNIKAQRIINHTWQQWLQNMCTQQRLHSQVAFLANRPLTVTPRPPPPNIDPLIHWSDLCRSWVDFKDFHVVVGETQKRVQFPEINSVFFVNNKNPYDAVEYGWTLKYRDISHHVIISILFDQERFHGQVWHNTRSNGLSHSANVGHENIIRHKQINSSQTEPVNSETKIAGLLLISKI